MIKIYSVCIISFLFNIGFSQTECMSINGDELEVNTVYLSGVEHFTEEIQTAIKNIETFFDVDLTFYLARGYDAICHKYISFKKGEITVGIDFYEKYKDDPLLFEFIIAHEVGHTIQHSYKMLYQNVFQEKYGKKVLLGKYFEMQADIIAGYYLTFSLVKKTNNYTKEQKDSLSKAMERMVLNMAKLSDLKFTHSKHHGDLVNRYRAFRRGSDLYHGGVGGPVKMNEPDLFSNVVIDSLPTLYYYSFLIIEERLREKQGIKIDNIKSFAKEYFEVHFNSQELADPCENPNKSFKKVQVYDVCITEEALEEYENIGTKNYIGFIEAKCFYKGGKDAYKNVKFRIQTRPDADGGRSMRSFEVFYNTINMYIDIYNGFQF